MWQGTKGTVTEGNLFLNCQRGIAYGLDSARSDDHQGGVIRNNFFYRSSVQSGDVGISLNNSAGTEVLHNTVVLSGTYPDAIEYRFAATTGVQIRNNLSDAAVTLRDGASGTVSGNVTNAQASWFVNAAMGICTSRARRRRRSTRRRCWRMRAAITIARASQRQRRGHRRGRVRGGGDGAGSRGTDGPCGHGGVEFADQPELDGPVHERDRFQDRAEAGEHRDLGGDRHGRGRRDQLPEHGAGRGDDLLLLRVCDQRPAGDSADSNEAYATTAATIPAAPTGLVAVAASSSQINLSWTDRSSNETGFKIERKLGSTGTWAADRHGRGRRDQLPEHGAGRGDDLLLLRVRDQRRGRFRRFQRGVCDHGGDHPGRADGPYGHGGVEFADQPELDRPVRQRDGLQDRAEAGEHGDLGADRHGGRRRDQLPDAGLAAGTTYYYRVRATNSAGDSAYSNEANATTATVVTVPAAPTGLAAAAASCSQINLSWTDRPATRRASRSSGSWGAPGPGRRSPR